MVQMTAKRNQKIEDFMHKASVTASGTQNSHAMQLVFIRLKFYIHNDWCEKPLILTFQSTKSAFRAIATNGFLYV